ncbi:MAG: hypothetical protein AB8G86_04985 [Saprospiraceae bacterium]
MEKPEFKFSEIISILETDCPPKEFEQKETKAFRWVFEAMENELNFSPQYLKKPARFQKQPPDIKCKAVGLSFFSTEENARMRFNILTARMLASVKNKVGENVAAGIIYEKDGVSDIPDKKGHFTLHPYLGENLIAQFKIIGKL